VQRSTSISVSASAEAAAKREDALAAVGGPFATSDPATVRWLLCGRGAPIDSSSSASPYRVVVAEDAALVLFQDIEASRVAAEERWDELGYEAVPYPWHRAPPVEAEDVEAALAPLRRELRPEERERYRVAGADAAAAMVEAVGALQAGTTEQEAAAELAFRLHARGFHTPVLLVAGAERQRMHRHPLPTGADLGRHALLAATAERDGLYVSLTRLLSFGAPPDELARLVRAAAEVDAAMLEASAPGTPLRQVLAVADEAYAARGFPGEWRRHHQGGIAGYRGREVFATPEEETVLPGSCAVAWNPSITGGAKSEDTALVSEHGVEVVTRTPRLPELEVNGIPRPFIGER
jgi:Xaa-Pro aminopeptidase